MSDTIPKPPDRPGIYAGVQVLVVKGGKLVPIPLNEWGHYVGGHCVLRVNAVGVVFARQIKLRDGTACLDSTEPGDGSTWFTLAPVNGQVRQAIGVRLADEPGKFGPELLIPFTPK